MSQQFNIKSSDYDSSGPRPAVPGKEDNRKYKMTDSAQSDHQPFISSLSSSRSSSSPSCLKWARKLTFLLEDRDGVDLFKKYVELEGGIHRDRLNFYFACEGLKQQNDSEKVRQIIGAIYRFLKKSQLHVPDGIKQTIKTGLKDKNFVLTPDLFDQMQQDVENVISETTYRSFLQSESYLHYVDNFYSGVERSNISPVHTTTATSLSMSESFLSRSSTLPTLHEEFDGPTEEGAIGGFAQPSNRMPIIGGSSTSSTVPLTFGSLIATQHQRLEMRRPGAHGYSAYNAISYNPVSRRDSEMASMSSGRTDSDTMSISSNVVDGRSQRKHQSRHQNLIPNIETEPNFIIPRTQQIDPSTKILSPTQLYIQLSTRLELLKKDQDGYALLNKQLNKDQTDRLINDAIQRKLGMVDDKNDQDILDEHVSRVWADRTPQRTPGSVSPRNLLQRRRPQETTSFGAGSSSSQSSMRTSRTLPDTNMRKFSKWGSINTDSGISLLYDTRNRDAMSVSSNSTTGSTAKAHRSQMLPPEIIQQAVNKPTHFEDTRRAKRSVQQPPLPQKNVVPPPLPAKSSSQPSPASSISSGSNTNEPHVIVVCSFCDEELPYRFKIPTQTRPTLKQFKDLLPKKGNYRFFFKTRCDDKENPIIQEEVSNDADECPLFEGTVMAMVKPAN